MKTVFVSSIEYDDSAKIIWHEGAAWEVVNTTFPAASTSLSDPHVLTIVPFPAGGAWKPEDEVEIKATEVVLLSDVEIAKLYRERR